MEVGMPVLAHQADQRLQMFRFKLRRVQPCDTMQGQFHMRQFRCHMSPELETPSRRTETGHVPVIVGNRAFLHRNLVGEGKVQGLSRAAAGGLGLDALLGRSRDDQIAGAIHDVRLADQRHAGDVIGVFQLLGMKAEGVVVPAVEGAARVGPLHKLPEAAKLLVTQLSG